MRPQFLHLTGPRRGRTDTPKGPEVVIGTGVDSGLRLGPWRGLADRHAVVTFDDCGCDFLIRALDGQVFVNHREVDEVILHQGDLVELGIGGPKLRFRVFHGRGASCKPVRTMLGDAAAVGRASGLVASGQSLVRDLLTQATLTLKIGFPVLVAGVVGLAFAAGWIGGGAMTSERMQQDLDALRAELEELRGRDAVATREDLEAIKTELATRSKALDALTRERAAVRSVLETGSRSVGITHGVWTLALPNSLRTPDRVHLSRADGSRVEIEYTGTGFHVGEGRVVTNRHVVLPWEYADEVEPMVARGFEPEMLSLSVTFPGLAPMTVAPESVRVREEDRIDVAVFSAPVPEDWPALEFDDRAAEETRGQTVLVLGYPTGVNALLAKADPGVSQQVVEAADGRLAAVIAGLAERGAVSPVITRGVLAEVQDERLVYDAETTSGGSGGPVLGTDGRVVGVNYAITVGFGGSNFGVPIRFVRPLLD
ncbi:MAG: trypsin-like peptidase domain-containing protein [Planctomycetota bacterium]|nr:trypsin-like peptidase domain-containing protein [Planctomycetota bacterium]